PESACMMVTGVLMQPEGLRPAASMDPMTPEGLRPAAFIDLITGWRTGPWWLGNKIVDKRNRNA
ncbi:MAG: hypothetical protein KDA55_23235, partial [Planctomycetales bacterium]|nr:hypothetical protein [Planctomycetales bacterium]